MAHRRLLALATTALLLGGLGFSLPRSGAPADETDGAATGAAAPGDAIAGALTRPLAELAAEYPVPGGATGLPPAEAAFEAAFGEGDEDAEAEAEAEADGGADARPNRPGDALAGRERLPQPRVVAPALATVPTGAVTQLGAATVADWTTGLGDGKEGIGSTFSVKYAPPDTAMDVGDRQIVEVVNVGMMVFDKASLQVQLGPIGIRSLWSSLGSNACATYDDGDPQVRWDARAQRWIVGQFAVSGSVDYMCLAVSQTADATGRWYAYAFAKDLFPDYPKLSIWGDSYWVTYNMFTRSFQGARVCSYARTPMLNGQATTERCFNTSTTYGGLLAADLDGTIAPPASMRQVMVGLGATNQTLAFWRRSSTDGTTTSAIAPTVEPNVGAYTIACGGSGGACVPQKGTTSLLDTLGDRLMARFAVRMDPSGEFATGLVAHSVQANGVTAIRWYRIRLDATGGITVLESQVHQPDTSLHRWMPSIASNTSGEIAVGYSASNSASNPSIRVAGRVGVSGALDVAETTLVQGAGSQVSTYSRWGDYTQMAIDPDGCSFWFVSEYYDQTLQFKWRTGISRFTLPGSGCSPVATSYSRGSSSLSATASPTTVAQGKAYSITVTLTGPGGARLAGRTVGITGSKSGSKVTASDGTAVFSFNAPRQITTLDFRLTYGGDWTLAGSTTTTSVRVQ